MTIHRPWTHEDIEVLRQLAESHVRVNAIARRLGRTAGAVRYRASQEGISLIEARATCSCEGGRGGGFA
jgi:hypothetical protein